VKKLLRKLGLAKASEEDMRNPNWCWTHGMMYPACAGMH